MPQYKQKYFSQFFNLCGFKLKNLGKLTLINRKTWDGQGFTFNCSSISQPSNLPFFLDKLFTSECPSFLWPYLEVLLIKLLAFVPCAPDYTVPSQLRSVHTLITPRQVRCSFDLAASPCALHSRRSVEFSL